MFLLIQVKKVLSSHWCLQSSSDEETSVQLKILQQLKVNSRLDVVEHQVAEVAVGRQQKLQKSTKHEQSKLSSTNTYSGSVIIPVGKPKHKKVKKLEKFSTGREKRVESDDTNESYEQSGDTLPDLASLRTSVQIHRQVNQRLRELEMLHGDSGNESKYKIKSKWGNPVDVVVKHKVAWPHEAILGASIERELPTTSCPYHSGYRVFVKIFWTSKIMICENK